MTMRFLLSFGFLFLVNLLPAQWLDGVYESEEKTEIGSVRHRIMVTDGYWVLTAYSDSPPAFLFTRGGFLQQEGSQFKVGLEFNSTFSKDSIRQLEGKIVCNHSTCSLVWPNGESQVYRKFPGVNQAFSGNYQMAGRVTGQEEARRRLDVPRKTLKLLQTGCFQWIAFNTESFEFSGTGGGTYSADSSGNYVETIAFFSRNPARAGATLPFTFQLKGDDWYHQGKSSAGDPMHEIWAKRKNP